MNNVNFVRERDEIEGALLLPEAHLVDTKEGEQFQNRNNLPIASVAATTPTTPAIALVPRRVACHHDDTVKQMLAQAERRGHVEAEIENEMVQKTQMNINAINYFESKRVEAANEIAQYKNRIEENISTIGEAQCESLKVKASSTKAAATTKTIEKQRQKQIDQEEFDGTYGKGGYEIPDYEISEYNFTTTDYETTEYKSVYDR